MDEAKEKDSTPEIADFLYKRFLTSAMTALDSYNQGRIFVYLLARRCVIKAKNAIKKI